MLRSYAEDEDIGPDDIDDELEFAKQRIETLRRRGSLKTKEAVSLQQKITDFESLTELRQLVVGHPRSPSRLTHLSHAFCITIALLRYVAILSNPLAPSLFTHRISSHTATMTCATIRHPILQSRVLTWSYQLRYHSPDCAYERWFECLCLIFELVAPDLTGHDPFNRYLRIKLQFWLSKPKYTHSDYRRRHHYMRTLYSG